MLVLAMQFSRADGRPDATEATHLENGTADGAEPWVVDWPRAISIGRSTDVQPVHQLGVVPREEERLTP
jgi:hypothetical protein